MTTPAHGSIAARALPPRPNLEHLKNEAKQRLDQLRADNPKAQLAEAQFQLAREYGFASWRELKATIDGRGAGQAPDPVGDWVTMMESGGRAALHISRLEGGSVGGTLDVPIGGYFDDPVDSLIVECGRLSFTVMVRSINALYRGEWDSDADAWVGNWTQNGFDFPMTFTRGVIPPASTFKDLDGWWDGVVEGGERKRLSFLVKTDRHGTRAWLDSPDSQLFNVPCRGIEREGDTVRLLMHNFIVEGELGVDGGAIHGRFLRDKSHPVLNLTRRAPGAAPPRKPLPPAIDLPPETLALYTGAYSRGTTLSPAELVAEQGRLFILTTGQPRLELVPVEDNRFVCREIEMEVSFDLEESRVTAMVMHVRGQASRMKRIG